MNDSTPLDTIGDEPLEARIVAWVLGEASAFEAAELERLCEERPELLVFRRRMRALHGLLTESEAAEPDDTWKLPADKRKALDEIFGEEVPAHLQQGKENQIRRSGRRALFAIAACLILTLFLAAVFSAGNASIQKARKHDSIISYYATKGGADEKVDFLPGGGGGGGSGAAAPESAASDQFAEMRNLSVPQSPASPAPSLRPGQPQPKEKSERGTLASESVFAGPASDADSSAASSSLADNEPPAESNAKPSGETSELASADQTFNRKEKDDVDRQARQSLASWAEGGSSQDFSGRTEYDTEKKIGPADRGVDDSHRTRAVSPSPSTSSERADNEPAKQGENQGAIDKNLSELDRAIRDQENRVEERRKVLATITRTKGIIYKGQDSFYGSNGVNNDQGTQSAEETFNQLEQKKMQLESQINSLLKYDSDQLVVYAAGLNLPDNIIKNLYPQYLERNLQLNSLKTRGLGENHPTVKAAKEQIEGMKRQLDEGVVNLRATLQAQLDMAVDRLKSVETANNSPRENTIKVGLDAQDYLDAKRDFEADQELLHQLKLKQRAETTTNDTTTEHFPMELGNDISLNPDTSEAFARDTALFDQAQPQLPETAILNDVMGAKAKPAPAKKSPLQSIEEIAASEEAYSTFSLNINDASFQIAKAALDKGERPDPAGIKVEQFYNAVDYGDPAPATNEPVAARIEQSAHPIIPGRNLVRVSLKTAAAGRGASQPLRLTLLVDQSGSMVREDRRTAMSNALKQLGRLLTPNDHITVVGFSRESHLLADTWTGDQAGKLGDLVNQTASEGGTNLEQAINLAEQMAARPHPAGEQNRIVLFTDGAANLGNANPERLAERVKSLRQKGIAFDIAGIGADGVNDRLLSELARNGNGRYYVVSDEKNESFARQLAGAFRPAAENVKVQVHFNPERVGRYKLIGFEKDRLKTEDFRNDAVDAAELAAEEAGVAVYQVETLPQGSGEIGEVSVRFRDTSKDEMVERKWTMPFESTTQPFDRATPSMQLAGLSMLAAEKLKGGPLADAIDFKQLSGSQSLVKQFYGSSSRVADMLRVIDLLK